VSGSFLWRFALSVAVNAAVVRFLFSVYNVPVLVSAGVTLAVAITSDFTRKKP